MRKPNTDLYSALNFVIDRIGDEADRSGAPLDDAEKHFLRHLPTSPTNPTLRTAGVSIHSNSFPMPLRDLGYERLCTLARNAHDGDLQIHPEAARQWEFAGAVLKLNRHPMSWLLEWAGIKLTKARAISDGCLLLTTGVLVVILLLTCIFAVLLPTKDHTNIWIWTVRIAVGCVFVVMSALLYFGARWLEDWQGKQTVEKYRCELPIERRSGIKA